MRTLCAVLFITFTFTYLYFYQADVMMATQHLLSGGQTHYERTIGAVLITVALYVLHLGVLAVTKLTHRAHSLWVVGPYRAIKRIHKVDAVDLCDNYLFYVDVLACVNLH